MKGLNVDITKEDIPVCFDIVTLAKKQGYGEINISLTTHESRIVNMTSSSFRIKKFKDNENALATAELVSMIKNIADKKQSGNITFSLSYKDGHIKQLTTQFLEKKHYKGIEKKEAI